MFDNLFAKPEKNNNEKIFIFSLLSAIIAGIATFLLTPFRGKEAREMVADKSEKAVTWSKKKAKIIKSEIKKEIQKDSKKIKKVDQNLAKKAKKTTKQAQSQIKKVQPKSPKKPQANPKSTKASKNK